MVGRTSRTGVAPSTAPTAFGDRRALLLVSALLALGAGVVAALSTTGSDAFWPVALGNHIRATGTVPDGVPFATADTAGWVNTTVLGQLLFSAVGSAGSLGLLAAQTISALATLTIVAAETLRRDSPPARTALVTVALALGGATAFLIARVQLLSLVPFALTLLILRSEHERPTRRVWLVIPLLALWGNLHGAVLIGIAVTCCYLLFSRLRREPLTAVAVGCAALAAACANPGLWRAPAYYIGVLGGEATSDSSGMWGRPDLTNPFDLTLVAVALLLAVMAFRRRRALWEYAAVAGLAVATVTASRNGIWLLIFLAGCTAAGAAAPMPPSRWSTDTGKRPDVGPGRRGHRSRPVLLMVGVAGLAGLLVCTLTLTSRWPRLTEQDSYVAAAARASAGRVVLAPEPLSEHLAAAGATVWVSNPLDAFRTPDQAAYLAFQRAEAEGAAPALAEAQVVVAPTESAQAGLALRAGFRLQWRAGPFSLFSR